MKERGADYEKALIPMTSKVVADNNATPNEEVNNGGEISETPTDSTATEPETKVSDPNPYHIHLSID